MSDQDEVPDDGESHDEDDGEGHDGPDAEPAVPLGELSAGGGAEAAPGPEDWQAGPDDFQDPAIAAQRAEVLAYLYSHKAAKVARCQWHRVKRKEGVSARSMQDLVSDVRGAVTEAMLTMLANRDRRRQGPMVWDPSLSAYVNQAIHHEVIRQNRRGKSEHLEPPVADQDEDDGERFTRLEVPSDDDPEAIAVWLGDRPWCLECVRRYIQDALLKETISKDAQYAAVVASAALGLANAIFGPAKTPDAEIKELLLRYLEDARPGYFQPHPDDDHAARQRKQQNLHRYGMRSKTLLAKAIGNCGCDEGREE